MGAMKRTARIERKTTETTIQLELTLDGTGRSEVATGVGFLDHMLELLARHAAMDLTVKATGDLEIDQHHTVEDVAICLGKALGEALGEKRGIVRMAAVTIPMDEALVSVAIDISGRGYAVLDLPFTGNDMFGFATDLVRHFLESFASEARLNLHARIIYGGNDHHKALMILEH